MLDADLTMTSLTTNDKALHGFCTGCAVAALVANLSQH
jgi:hypothetical protein